MFGLRAAVYSVPGSCTISVVSADARASRIFFKFALSTAVHPTVLLSGPDHSWRKMQLPASATGGSIATVTNFGTFGLTWATPIPLPEQTLVLGLGAGKRAPQWDEAKQQFIPVMEANLTLSFDHRVLSHGVQRDIERVAVPKGDEERARRPHLFGDVAQQLDRDSRNSLSLQLRCHQAHGLVAHGSDGNQQCDVHLPIN